YDPVGYRTGQTFDPTGLARTLRYTNNADGSVKSQTLTGTASPGRSETTSFTYDAAGRQLATSVDNTGGTPATLTTTDVRDPRGLVTAETDPAGTTTGFGYDLHGQLVTVTGAARTTWVNGTSTANVSPVTTFGYDTFDDATKVRDAAGAVTTVGYDPMGRTSAVTRPAYTPPGGTAVTPSSSAVYDTQGRLTQVTDPLGRTTQLGYDLYGNAISVTAPDPDGAGPKTAPVTTTTYDRDGEPLRVTGPTGGQSSITYDNLGRASTTSVSDRDTGQTVFFTTSYGYDAAGNLSSVTSPLTHTSTLA